MRMPKAATAARFPMSASLICLMLSSWRLWVFVSSLAEMNTDSFVLTAVGHQPPTNTPQGCETRLPVSSPCSKFAASWRSTTGRFVRPFSVPAHTATTLAPSTRLFQQHFVPCETRESHLSDPLLGPGTPAPWRSAPEAPVLLNFRVVHAY